MATARKRQEDSSNATTNEENKMRGGRRKEEELVRVGGNVRNDNTGGGRSTQRVAEFAWWACVEADGRRRRCRAPWASRVDPFGCFRCAVTVWVDEPERIVAPEVPGNAGQSSAADWDEPPWMPARHRAPSSVRQSLPHHLTFERSPTKKEILNGLRSMNPPSERRSGHTAPPGRGRRKAENKNLKIGIYNTTKKSHWRPNSPFQAHEAIIVVVSSVIYERCPILPW
jgi:hypothetical protein